MNDLISRQAAIDAVQGIGRLATLPDNDAVVRMSAVEYVLFNLPTAQPLERCVATIVFDEEKLKESINEAIVRCKDCKHNPKHEWFGCPMSHLNERQRPETAWCWRGERRTDESD